jgi:hypothetical protein
MGRQGGGETHGFETKSEAVMQAAAAGRMLENAQVVIRKKDGKIQSERTHGSDPAEPRDRGL